MSCSALRNLIVFFIPFSKVMGVQPRSSRNLLEVGFPPSMTLVKAPIRNQQRIEFFFTARQERLLSCYIIGEAFSDKTDTLCYHNRQFCWYVRSSLFGYFLIECKLTHNKEYTCAISLMVWYFSHTR